MIIFIFTICGFDAYAENIYSGFLTGKGWKTFTPEFKLFYLKGFKEGISAYEIKFILQELSIGASQDKIDETIQEISLSKKYSSPNLTNQQMSEVIDQFYDDYKNINIPVAEALYIINMEIEGQKKDDIEAYKEAARKVASQ